MSAQIRNVKNAIHIHTKSKPKEDGGSFFGATPTGKGVLEIIAKLFGMGIFTRIFTTGLCPCRYGHDETDSSMGQRGAGNDAQREIEHTR